MKIIFFLMFSLSMLTNICSCKIAYDKNKLSGFKQLQNIKDGSSIYVIPGSGCTGCISDIENFALKNGNSDTVFFVFTRLNSFKLFRNRFGNSFISSKNIIIDTANIYTFEEKNLEIYPVVYKKRNGKILLITHLKPQ